MTRQSYLPSDNSVWFQKNSSIHGLLSRRRQQWLNGGSVRIIIKSIRTSLNASEKKLEILARAFTEILANRLDFAYPNEIL